ncbi:MFS transporter [Streptomyces hirsutus]
MSTGPGADSAPAPDTHDTPTDPEAPDRATRTSKMFSSLKVRNYRLFFIGQVVSNIGTWMQRIAQDWLVLTLTASSAAVGITTALQFLPMLLFGLYGGVLVDRLRKRPTLLVTQSAMALTSLALAALTLTGQVEVWHVYVAAFVTGLATVVDNPARQSFVAELVGPGQLQNAVSLNSANFQSARLVGPAVAGLLITGVGTGWAFLLNGVSFVAPLAGLMMMRARELHAVTPSPRGKGQLREGLRYVAGRPELLWPIVLVGFIGTFAFNFPVYLSAFADDVFHGGAGAYSLFNTLMAVGSLAGALLAARRGTARLRLLILAAVAFGGTGDRGGRGTHPVAVRPAHDPDRPVRHDGQRHHQHQHPDGHRPRPLRGRVMALYMMVFLGASHSNIVSSVSSSPVSAIAILSSRTVIVALLPGCRSMHAAAQYNDTHGDQDTCGCTCVPR